MVWKSLRNLVSKRNKQNGTDCSWNVRHESSINIEVCKNREWKIDLYIHGRLTLTRVPRPFSKEKIVSLRNGAGTAEYLHGKKWIWTLISCYMQTLTSNG